MHQLAWNVPSECAKWHIRVLFSDTPDLSTIVIMCIYNVTMRHSNLLLDLPWVHWVILLSTITATGRQSLLINKSFNCDILLELVFLGIQDPMFQTFLVFFKIINVISGIFVYLYQVYRIPGPPLADPNQYSHGLI
jgi:hypothetical protein